MVKYYATAAGSAPDGGRKDLITDNGNAQVNIGMNTEGNK